MAQHLIDVRYQGRMLAEPGHFDWFIEGGRIEPMSKPIGSNGFLAARFIYSGVISINPCSAPEQLIVAFCSFYLMNNAGVHDSKAVEFSNDLNDDNSADIELTIEQFVEDVELVESENGPFELNWQGQSKKFDFGESSLWMAEAISVNAQVET